MMLSILAVLTVIVLCLIYESPLVSWKKMPKWYRYTFWTSAWFAIVIHLLVIFTI